MKKLFDVQYHTTFNKEKKPAVLYFSNQNLILIGKSKILENEELTDDYIIDSFELYGVAE